MCSSSYITLSQNNLRSNSVCFLLTATTLLTCTSTASSCSPGIDDELNESPSSYYLMSNLREN